MKKIILLFVFSLALCVEVTFNVDMSDQEVGSEGPTLWMGAYYPAAGFIMSDDDGDQVWSYTIDLDPGTYTYKFRNGWWTDWNTGSGWEDVPQECEVGDYGDREVVVSNENLNINPVCFSSCSSECIEIIYSNVTFQVDMTDEDLLPTDIVYVNGTFNGWCGTCNPMSDANEDGIWELTIELGAGSYEYIYTTNGWDGLQAGAPIGSECDFLSTDSYGNYGFTLDGEDVLLDLYCFGTCYDECVQPVPVDVTFNVDMNGEIVNDGVFMIGSYQSIVPWSQFIAPTQMSDENGDGIYSATVSLMTSEYIEYKFVNGSGVSGLVESNEGIGACGSNPNATCSSPGSSCNNRFVDIPSCELDSNDVCILDPFSIDAVSFDSCGSTIANVNFTIDLNGTGYPNSDHDQCGVNGSWCATESGDWPGWCFTLDDDDGDNIFTGTLEGLSSGNYEFIVFCSGAADNFSGWGVQFGPSVGSECDFDSSDEFGNYGFTIIEDNVDVSLCAGSCDSTCSGSSDGGSTDTNYIVTFDLDGVDDCGFVSVTGTFDNWSGWGANDNSDFEAEVPNGDYEFVVLCVDTSNELWYNDIWGSSSIVYAPQNSSCDFIPDDDNYNYGFTVSDDDIIVSYCLGTCNQTCEEQCVANGDANQDLNVNVSDIILIINHIIGTSTLSDLAFCSSDMNNDGTINVTDIISIVNLIIG